MDGQDTEAGAITVQTIVNNIVSVIYLLEDVVTECTSHRNVGIYNSHKEGGCGAKC